MGANPDVLHADAQYAPGKVIGQRYQIGCNQGKACFLLMRWMPFLGSIPHAKQKGRFPVQGKSASANLQWGERWDLNPRPPGPQPGATTS
jgi:hypothetical protein